MKHLMSSPLHIWASSSFLLPDWFKISLRDNTERKDHASSSGESLEGHNSSDENSIAYASMSLEDSGYLSVTTEQSWPLHVEDGDSDFRFTRSSGGAVAPA